MKKIISILLLTCISFFSLTLCLATPQEPTVEKDAALQWVLDQTKDRLPEHTARQIVDHAYWHSEQLKLDPMLVLAMMKVESGFNTRAKSSEGAQGLLQVLPRYHRDKLRGRSAYEPTVGIEVGAIVLNDCMERSRGSMLKAMNCYSGGGGMKYLNKVLNVQRDARRSVLFSIFDKRQMVVAESNVN